MEMLVAMNYAQDGARTISAMYAYPWLPADRSDLVQWLGENNDEVYTVELDNNDKRFIDGIVTEGCRIV